MAVDSDDRKPEDDSSPRAEGRDRIEEKIDRDLKDSFPASDPPGWVLGVKRPRPAKEENDEDKSSHEEEAGG